MTTEKQAYVPPVLRSHGTVRALTRVRIETSPEIELCSVVKDAGEAP